MTLDVKALVRVGQAVNACYDRFFLDRPERVKLSSPHSVIWGTDADGPRPYGVIYNDADLGAWVCVLRGTDSEAEWRSDADAALVDCPFLPGARTHRGFTTIHQTLIADGHTLRYFLAGCARPLIVAGHSLGAALATLVAANVGGADLVTFAGPRVGDDAFATMAASRLASNWRFVNSPDVVPKLPLRLPPLFPYADVGPAHDLDSIGKVIVNAHAWHDLDTYLHLLDPTHPLNPKFVLNAI